MGHKSRDDDMMPTPEEWREVILPVLWVIVRQQQNRPITMQHRKPVDRWLALAGLAVAVVLWMIPRTKTSVIVCGILFFACLFHPAWNLWWIEYRLWRRALAVIMLAAVTFVLCRISLTGVAAIMTGTTSTAPNPSPTPMVRFYGGAFWSSRPIPNSAKRQFFVNVCVRNFGDEPVHVTSYFAGYVFPNEPSVKAQLKHIEWLRDKVNEMANAGHGIVTTIDPDDPTLLQCSEDYITHQYSIFSQPLSNDEMARLNNGFAIFYYVDLLTERNTQGETREPLCGMIMTKSAPMVCPESGSSDINPRLLKRRE